MPEFVHEISCGDDDENAIIGRAYLKMAAQSCKYFRRLVGAVAVAALPFLTPGPAAARDVVYIMADDISSSPPVNGYPMPGLASIAEQGVRYTFGHAAPLCTPARVEALTGRLGARFGISANWPKLATTVPTVQSILRSHGWATHFIGKWHVSTKNPLDHGFDTFYGSLKGQVKYFGNTPDIPTLDQRKRWYNQGYITTTYTDRAVRILKAPSGGRNRLLLVWLNNAHDPLEATPEQLALVPSGLSEKDRLRAAVTIQFDRAVERILAATTPDDMVILTGDNSLGTTPGLRGTKGSIWEGGIRVPFLIRAPGRLAAGRTNSTAVRLADLLPTILDFAGLPIPGGLDGQSLLGAVPRDRPLPFVAPRLGDRDYGEALLIDRWKYYRGVEGVTDRLYDLSSDSGEANDLATIQPERVAAMRAKLTELVGP